MRELRAIDNPPPGTVDPVAGPGERPFDSRDRVYAGVRAAALVAGLSEVGFGGHPAAGRTAVLWSMLAFAAYTAALYGLVWPALSPHRKPVFYATAAAGDLVFLAVLLALTGGAASPFDRALYLWVAMLAFYFGRRGGLVASSAAFLVYVFFHLDRLPGTTGPPGHDNWLLAVQAGGLLMHGPLVGYLADRERARAEELRAARDGLASVNQKILDGQARLIQAEKLSSIGLLASGLAHEINNPLTGVIGCVQALRAGSVAPERRSQYFATIGDGLERIRATVQSLLDFTRHRPRILAPIDAADLAGSCVRLVEPMASKRRVTFAQRIAPCEATVCGDRSQLLQALLNLLVNAAYASPEGGEVAVTLRRGPGHAGISVEDHGGGIPAAILARVCDPFFTTKPEGEGTGLGLTVTLGIARAHGGDLEIESEEARGTVVTLWIPEESPKGGGVGAARA